MAKTCSIIINGAILLTPEQDLGYPYWELGYFECDAGFADMKVYVNGEESKATPTLKLGAAGGLIDVTVEKAGKGLQTAVTNSSTLHSDVLHRHLLYGEAVPLEKYKFDSILRFHSGSFRPSLVKRRFFKQYIPGQTLTNPIRKDMGAIAHNVVVHYSLDDGDRVAIASTSRTYFEQIIDHTVNQLEIELLSDDSTSEKYFCHCVQPGRPFYWVPNQGLPPITSGP